MRGLEAAIPSTSTPGPAFSLSPVRALTLGVVALAVHAHARFIVADDRVPGDLGMYYTGVPHAFDLVMGRSPGTFGEWFHTVSQPTGWYHLLLAGLLATLGRNQDVFLAPGLLWVLIILLVVDRLARRLGGDLAALSAVSIVAAMPGVFLAGRTGWIHVPEAALVLTGLLAWVSDPGLSRRRTALAIGITGGLALALRPSGLVWVGSLGVLLALVALRARRGSLPSPRGLWIVLATWALGAAASLWSLRNYLDLKAAARERYAALLPDLGFQFQLVLGVLPGLVVVLGLVLGVVVLARRRRAPKAPPAPIPDPESWVPVLLGAWVVLALVLWLVFQSGLDNFTLICPALALLAAAAWSRMSPRVGATLSLVAFLPAWGLQWIPPRPQDSLLRRIPGLREIPTDPHVLSSYRPLDGFGESEIRSLVSATCGEESPPQRCAVVADQGLFAPFGEEPGYLELFLSGETRVRLFTLRDEPLPMSQRIEALAEFHCGERDRAWRIRWPRSLPNLEDLLSRARLEPVWTTSVGPECTFLWFTPKGYVAQPELLPQTGTRLMAGEPASPEQLKDAEPREGEKMQRIRPNRPAPSRREAR